MKEKERERKEGERGERKRREKGRRERRKGGEKGRRKIKGLGVIVPGTLHVPVPAVTPYPLRCYPLPPKILPLTPSERDRGGERILSGDNGYHLEGVRGKILRVSATTSG